MKQLKESDKDTTEANSKWKRLGDLALANGNLELSEKCAEASGDMAGLLLLYTSVGNIDGTKALCEKVSKIRESSILCSLFYFKKKSASSLKFFFFFSFLFLFLSFRPRHWARTTWRSWRCSCWGASRTA
jgi:hypothetical protein